MWFYSFFSTFMRTKCVFPGQSMLPFRDFTSYLFGKKYLSEFVQIWFGCNYSFHNIYSTKTCFIWTVYILVLFPMVSVFTTTARPGSMQWATIYYFTRTHLEALRKLFAFTEMEIRNLSQNIETQVKLYIFIKYMYIFKLYRL